MPQFASAYKRLNPDQAMAVDAIDGPVLVVAGPGTGKTQLLSLRAASIIEKKDIQPENILILTYTNFAAKEMKERLAGILGLKGYDVGVFTFHSFANSIILESEEAADYIEERTQMTDVERVRAIEYILDNAKGMDAIRPFGAPYLYQREIWDNIRDLKNEGVTPGDFAAFHKDLRPDGFYIEAKHIPRLKAFAAVYAMYEELKTGREKAIFDERGRYDYEDMIIVAREALGREALLKEKYQRQYPYIMVDEFQDTNSAQLELLFALADMPDANIACVGDDDQSIYRFQGASVGNFKILREAFPALKVIHLKENYRSTRELIDLSTRIIGQIPPEERLSEKKLLPKKDYKDKIIEFLEFSTEDEELTFIVRKIEELKDRIEKAADLPAEERKRPYNNIAVLVRKRAYILKVIDAFLKAGIPYATDGLEDIRSEKRVRQLLDALELANVKMGDGAAADLTLYKVLSADYFGIEQADILRFIRCANRKKGLGRAGREERDGSLQAGGLFCEFMSAFPVDLASPPERDDTERLAILKELDLRRPQALHRASWVIHRLVSEAHDRPVHDILMSFIKDSGLYRHILKTYEKENVIRIRELRTVTSFVNMVKNSDLSRPGISLEEFMEEIELQAGHDMPLQGQLVTETQDGVRVYTAHGSKGLEFHTVIIPFCLQDKSWPVKAQGEKLPLPPGIFKAKETAADKVALKRLRYYDETRLFYVAASRTKANLIITASPTERNVLSPYAAALGIKIREALAPEEAVLAGYLAKSEREDPFIGTGEVLVDMVKGLVMTPTKLNNYLRCRRRFLYDNVLKLPGPKKQSLVFGNCAHEALEEAFGAYMKTGRLPGLDSFVNEFMRQLNLQGVSASIRAGCVQKLESLKLWYERESKRAVLPIDLEKKMIANVGDGILLVGKYDKMEFADKTKAAVRVIDYKTGEPDKHIRSLARSRDLASEECDDFLRQLVSYRLLYERDKASGGPYRVKSGMLVFLEPVKEDSDKYGLKKGEFRNEEVEISNDMVKELEKVIVKCWRDIQDLKFDKLPERDKDKCGKCDFDEICWGSL